MSLAIPSDGRERSGSGETQARPKATGLIIEKHALVHYLNEKSFIWQKVAEASMKSKAVGAILIMNILLSFDSTQAGPGSGRTPSHSPRWPEIRLVLLLWSDSEDQ